jgi:hypothetical protein
VNLDGNMPPRPDAAPVKVHIAATGNGFMRDIATWLCEAAAATGRRADLVDDELPSADGTIHLVVAPHEFFELFPAPTAELQRAAAASICVGTEQPGTPWFHLTIDACRRGLHTLDINPHGVDALRAVGVTATHLQLGAVASMTAPPADRLDRPIDVLFMGGLDDRRGAALAELGRRLSERRSDLRLFRFDRPVSAATPGLVFGRDKYELLASAKVLVNIHRDRSAHYPSGESPPHYFEWARMVEAMANRCVVLSEPAETSEPLVAGEHFACAELDGGLDGFGDALDLLLDDDTERQRVADRAFRAVTDELRLDRTMARVLDDLERDVLPLLAGHVAVSNPTRGLWRLGATKQAPPVRLGPFQPYQGLQRRAKALALDDTGMLRRLEAVASTLRYGTADHRIVTTTPGYDRHSGAPDVTAIVTLYNYADVVGETLDSLAASVGVDFEVVVVDDHSSDEGRRVVEHFMERRPDVPLMLIGKDVNAGLATARNDAFDAARARYVFVMDADNHVYPTCLARLADTLDHTPGAAAAYSILEDFGEQRNLRSALAWDPARLCAANYIDAQAMWRKSEWVALGGYRDDDEFVYGWEDWDLWLRLARAGGHAELRREILGRYRVRKGSMISLTNLETADAIAAMRSRYPDLPWPG